MKKLLCILLGSTIVVLSACSKNSVKINDPATIQENDSIIVNYVISETSYRSYNTAQELIESADIAIVGRVSGISFEVLDITSGHPPDEKSKMENYQLFTIYDVDIITTYKSEISDNVRFMIGGGVKDYRVEEQLELVKKKNAQPNDSILLQANIPEIEIGGTYLFTLRDTVLKGFKDTLPVIMIPQQSIHNLDNPFRKNTLSGHELGADYYARDVQENGDPIISAKDIISTFGKDKWEAFWADWQRSNPDWESRLDVAAVERALAE